MTKKKLEELRSAGDIARDEEFIYDASRRRRDACSDFFHDPEKITETVEEIKNHVNRYGALERLILDNVKLLSEDYTNVTALYSWLVYSNIYIYRI
jgi:hypothetical protein